MYIVKGRKVYPYHTITALIPLRIEKSGLAEIVIIWLTYRICSPISKSIVCSSFFLLMFVDDSLCCVLLFGKFCCFLSSIFCTLFCFFRQFGFLPNAKWIFEQNLQKKVQNRKVTYHRILHIRNSLGIKFQRQNFKFLDQINPKSVLPIQKWKKRKSRSNFTYSN